VDGLIVIGHELDRVGLRFAAPGSRLRRIDDRRRRYLADHRERVSGVLRLRGRKGARDLLAYMLWQRVPLPRQGGPRHYAVATVSEAKKLREGGPEQ